MEPLSALSVAAAAVQFLDFGTQLIGDARKIYSSSRGLEPEFVELSQVAKDLSIFSADIDAKMQASKLSESLAQTPAGMQGESEQTLFRLCQECKAIEAELQAALGKLEAQGTTKLRLAVDSLVVALKGLLSTKSLDVLKERLYQARNQLTIALLVVFWGTAQKHGMSIMEFQKEQAKTLHSLDESVCSLGNTIRELVTGSSLKSRSDAQSLKDYILASNWTPSEPMKAATLENADTRYILIASGITESLAFETIDHRELAIPEAHAETFQWVFQEPRRESGEPLWSDLRTWMSDSQTDMYWISGKAGAGKSTLVKFLLNDGRLQSGFKRWSGKSHLLLATYYSWNAGNELQKSPEGLLRSLLHQCLREHPMLLVPVVFPSRWALVQLLNLDPCPPSWTMEDLLAGFRNLVAHAGRHLTDEFGMFRLALVIDGLDEFQGDHGRLLEIISEANSNPNVKVCVSSRPWNVFRDAFNQNPMLRLELLTRHDIQAYVKSKFSCSPGYKESEALYPQQSKKLVTDILNKAQGVFLWVAIVVMQLLVHLQEGSRLFDLQAVLDSLPSDISRLFQVMWERTNEGYREEAAQLFLVIETYEKFDLTPYALSVWMGAEDAPLELESDPSSFNSGSLISNIISALRRILDSRTKGLLEIYETPDASLSRVDYMHRTAREWARENWGMLMEAIRPDFHPHIWLFKGETALMPLKYFAAPKNDRSAFLPHLQRLADLAKQVETVRPNAPSYLTILEKLDERLTNLIRLRGQDGVDIAGEQDDIASGMVRSSRIHWCKAPAIQPDHIFTPIKFVGGLEEVPLHDHDVPKERERCRKCQNPRTVPRCKHCLSTEPPAVPIIINVIFGGFIGSPVYRKLGGNRLHHSQRLDLLSFLLPYSSVDEVEGALELLHCPLQLRAMMGLACGRADSNSLRDRADDVYITEAAALLGKHLSKRQDSSKPGRFSGVCSNVEQKNSCKNGTKVSENGDQTDGNDPMADKLQVSRVKPMPSPSEQPCSEAKLGPEPTAPKRRLGLFLCCLK